MFYSHQLLARKAPLGQIWMAATMHAKMNRKKLDQIDIIRICEEILNPSVPMALRLSGILMGGVVIVYERKVRLLYDDVNRLLIEINSAWKVKPAVDPTVLPKGRTQAKFAAVTLPENNQDDATDVEQSIDPSARPTPMVFQQTAFFAMRLDTIDELNESFMQSLKENEPNQKHHQAEAANITLDDPFDSFQATSGPYNRFERFDIEGDETTQFNIPTQDQTHPRPPSPVHSTPPEMEPHQKGITMYSSKIEGSESDAMYAFMTSAIVGDSGDLYSRKDGGQSPAERAETVQTPKQNIQPPGPARKKARRQAPFIMDDEQTMIPSNLYQSWLQDSTDICSRRPNVVEANQKPIMKLAKLIELPPVALSCGLIGKDYSIYYPQPLLQLWLRSIQPPHDSPSGRSTSPRAPEPSSSSPPMRGEQFPDPPEFPMGDFGNGAAFDTLGSRERLRSNQPTGVEFPMDEFNLNFSKPVTNDPLSAPGSSGGGVRSSSVPSPAPGIDFSNSSDSSSGRFNRKRPFSSSRHNGIGLETLDEENQWIHEAAENNIPVIQEHPEPSFKMPKRSRYGLTPEQELLVETQRITQTQRHAIDEETEMMTSNITAQLKTYFETPGASQTESLNQLAIGMNRKQAAQLFYQTCVLATRDVLKVCQNLAYGDIIISRGAKM